MTEIKKILIMLLILNMSIYINSIVASNFWGGKYISYTPISTAADTVLANNASQKAVADYHSIEFYESPVAESEITNSIGASTYLYYERNDDHTYPSTSSFESSTSTGGNASDYSVYSRFLLSKNWKHSKSYIAWDVTESSDTICNTRYDLPRVYTMKIKFFDCVNDASNFFSYNTAISGLIIGYDTSTDVSFYFKRFH